MDVAYSIHGVPIRLTDERWDHIVDNHDEMEDRYDDVLLVVENPEWVTRGHGGAFVAWRGFGRQRYLCVHYRRCPTRMGL